MEKSKILVVVSRIGTGLLVVTGVVFIFTAFPLGVINILGAVLLLIFTQTVLKNQKLIEELQKQLSDAQELLNDPMFISYAADKKVRDDLKKQIDDKEAELAALEEKYNSEEDSLKKKNELIIQQYNETIAELRQNISQLKEELEKLQKKQTTAQNKLNKTVELFRSIEYATDSFYNSEGYTSTGSISDEKKAEIDELAPSVILKLHSMDMKDLRKVFRQNDRDIQTVLAAYVGRYTTKANQCIYQLMVIALRSELQNILVDLRYEKLDVAVEKVKTMTAKYLAIAGTGNQSIVTTLTKFIGQVEYLFINAVKIEYNYYVKKEQARQEQLAIREQMRLEAQERKALEEEKKKIEKEEAKFTDEIEKLKNQATTAQDNELQALNARIAELEAQLSYVVVKKDEIVKLQNGKAGNIYIISNLGSFGDDVFKIGMTRRSDPQDRVNELGDASVPFKFDVHSFIFSDDAVELESKLHSLLSAKRVNKVNSRKEFFRISLDELEELVASVDPTAEFSRTMAAEEYRQSISSDVAYTSDYVSEDDAEE